MVAYTASKTAVAALTAALAEEVAKDGILVNAVAPSIMDTQANRQAMPKADFALWPKVEEVGGDDLVSRLARQSRDPRRHRAGVRKALSSRAVVSQLLFPGLLLPGLLFPGFSRVFPGLLFPGRSAAQWRQRDRQQLRVRISSGKCG